jgi:hypothetical protein
MRDMDIKAARGEELLRLAEMLGFGEDRLRAESLRPKK